jgi:hypothetical protein
MRWPISPRKFIEMRDKTASKTFRAKKKLDQSFPLLVSARPVR